MNDRFAGLIKEGSEEEALLRKIDGKKLPLHLAVIMDGNGRWARQNGLTREEGHKRGVEAARKITEYALRIGIKYLTLFTFSSENWQRPIKEVNMLMNMFYDKLIEQKDLLVENDIKLQILGEIDGLPTRLKDRLLETIELSKSHKNMQVNLALNYGGRREIVNAVKKILEAGIPAGKIDEKLFARYLYSTDCPDPDLLIRTSGELRISNFLLFQIAYAELYFTKTLWPDFNLKELFKALLDYQNRERRFGKI